MADLVRPLCNGGRDLRHMLGTQRLLSIIPGTTFGVLCEVVAAIPPSCLLAIGVSTRSGLCIRVDRAGLPSMRILYRNRTAWVDLGEEPEGTELEPWEREALQAVI